MKKVLLAVLMGLFTSHAFATPATTGPQVELLANPNQISFWIQYSPIKHDILYVSTYYRNKEMSRTPMDHTHFLHDLLSLYSVQKRCEEKAHEASLAGHKISVNFSYVNEPAKMCSVSSEPAN